MKKIWIITLFPEYFTPLYNFGITGAALRGERKSKFEFNIVQLKNFTPKDFKGVDDSPYGGGAGMVMRADVLKEAFTKGVVQEGNYGENYKEKLHVVYPSPRGRKLDNTIAREFSKYYKEENKDIVFICGRYEGIDERFIQNYVDEEISLGDFVLTGGELAVMTIIDSSLRFFDGVLGNKESSNLDSFENNLLEHPQYTRPQIFDEISVPEILLSGNHAEIEKYRKNESLRLTEKLRPDLIDRTKK